MSESDRERLGSTDIVELTDTDEVASVGDTRGVALSIPVTEMLSVNVCEILSLLREPLIVAVTVADSE